MGAYQQYLDLLTGEIAPGIIRTSDSMFIPNAPGNKDWDEYELWLAEGNTPDPPATART